MKKLTSIIIFILALLTALTSCNINERDGKVSSEEDKTQQVTATDKITENSEDSTENKSKTENNTKELKVLACGHSLIRNSVRYITLIARSLGTDITIGLVWRGDATFKVYLDLYKCRNRFIYEKSNDSQFLDAVNPSENTFIDDLKDDNWDVIAVNQGFLYSDYPDSREDFPLILNIIKSICPNTPIYHNLGLAYMDGCQNSLFLEQYKCNTDVMFETIVNDVIENIAVNKDISGIIPTGTLIKSLTTSKYKDYLYVGDKVHLDVYGSYAAGIMWYAVLTGASVEDLEWMPEGVDPGFRDLVKNLVPRIIAEPYTVIDLGERNSDIHSDINAIEFKAFQSSGNSDGGYMAKFSELCITQNGKNGVDIYSTTGTEARCIWMFNNTEIIKYPILNYSIWGGGLSRICITNQWNDGIGDIELPVTDGSHSINIAELLSNDDGLTDGITYISVYTHSKEPVSIAHFCIMNTPAE